MKEFVDALGPFAWGFAIGYFWYPLWELGKGHNPHKSGSGQHDNRPKRLRTRGAKNRKALNDGW